MNALRLVSGLQAINIMLLFLQLYGLGWLGFVSGFFGFFIFIFIQLPMFIFLYHLKKKIISGLGEYNIKKERTHIDWKLRHSSLVAIFLLLGLISILDIFFGISADPKASDKYYIEATFYSDKTCSISFDGKLLEEKAEIKYRDRWIHCGGIIINIPQGGLVKGEFNLTNEKDKDGFDAGYGGAYFNNNLGMLLRPTPISTSVHWVFTSGTILIDSIEYLPSKGGVSKENNYSIVGSLDAIAKRHFDAP